MAGAKEAPRGAWPDGVRAVVVGGANNWADDFAKIPEGWATVVVAVNDVGTVLPEIDHWVSLHPEHFPRWEAEREAVGLAGDYVKWSRPFPIGNHRGQWTDRHTSHWGGGSGLLAVKVALELGAVQVVCAGMPLKGMANAFSGKHWEPTAYFLVDWERAAKRGDLERVRSLSGWTRDLVGAPEF